MIDAASSFSKAINSYFVVSLSPVATGILIFFAIDAIAVIFAGGVGSSSHIGSNFSILFASRIALAGVI